MRIRRVVGRLAVIGMLVCPAGVATAGQAGSLVDVTVLSGRPDMVTGTEALVQVEVPSLVALAAVRVTVNGADATAAFHADDDAHRLVGLVDGLTPGENHIAVTAGGRAGGASVTLRRPPGGGAGLLRSA